MSEKTVECETCSIEYTVIILEEYSEDLVRYHPCCGEEIIEELDFS